VSRAFTPAAWAALHAYLERQPPGASVERLQWLCVFVESTGLRAAELLRATRGDLVERGAGWVIRVHGKGRRNRTVPVPAVALRVTRAYFDSRRLDFATAAGETPLVAALDDAMAPIGYRSLYETFTRFVRRAVRESDLPAAEKERALRASAHWLRHTHATRAAERNVPPDVLQENLGQADPRTTARYYRAQMERRQRAMEKAFASGHDRGQG
jgi:integrase